MRKLVTIYRRKQQIFVVASHRTEAGFWVLDGEVSVVEATRLNDVGEVLAKALARSKANVNALPKGANPVKSLLAAAGVPSWNAFSKSTVCIDVHAEGGMLEITPYRNLGATDGFDPMTDKVVRMPETSLDVTKAVLAALETAR